MGGVEYGGAEAPGNVNNGDDAPGNVNNGDDDETEETEYELQKEDLYDIIGTLKEKVKGMLMRGFRFWFKTESCKRKSKG